MSHSSSPVTHLNVKKSVQTKSLFLEALVALFIRVKWDIIIPLFHHMPSALEDIHISSSFL